MLNAKAAWSLTFLLITPFDSSLFSTDSCLSRSFYGNVQDGPTTLSVLRPDADCLDMWTSHTFAPSASIVEVTKDVRQLVWLAEEAVDKGLKAQTQPFSTALDAFINTLSTEVPLQGGHNPAQQVINQPDNQTGFELLYRTPTAALISIGHNKASIIDTLIPRFWKSTLLPTSPVPSQPLTSPSVGHVEDTLSKLKFDPVVASIVSNISIPQMKNDIQFLTGEDGKSGIISRHSFTSGARTAASWLKAQFEDTGATCVLKPFLVGFAPNVIWCVATNCTNTSYLIS